MYCISSTAIRLHAPHSRPQGIAYQEYIVNWPVDGVIDCMDNGKHSQYNFTILRCDNCDCVTSGSGIQSYHTSIPRPLRAFTKCFTIVLAKDGKDVQTISTDLRRNAGQWRLLGAQLLLGGTLPDSRGFLATHSSNAFRL